MTLVILTQTEQKHLFEMFKHLTRLGEQYPLAQEEAMTDYKDHYLDSLEECSLLDATPLSDFLKYSYLETLQRILGFFEIVSKGKSREVGV